MKRIARICTACMAILLLLGCRSPRSAARTGDAGLETAATQSAVVDDSVERVSVTYIGKGVSDGAVSVKDFGAVGDGKTDDTEAIQAAISSDETIFFPAGRYNISQPIVITGKKFWSLYAQDACVVYSGEDYAIKINEAENCHIEIGEVIAERGGGIEFYSESQNNWNQYVRLVFNYIECASDCIYIRVTGGWCNENQVYGGRFAGGRNGVRVEYLGRDILNGWKFYNCGIEGVDNGFLFDAGTGYIAEMTVVNARYGESFDTILKTAGNVRDCLWLGTHVVEADMVLCSAETTRFEIIAPIGAAGHRGCIVDGELMVEEVTYKRAV